MAVKKKNNGRTAYFICLAVYVLLLIIASCVGLSVVWQYAKEYENSRPLNVVEDYVAHLQENLWDDNIANTIANMPHEFQSDEECAEHVKQMLSNGITYTRAASSDGGSVINYELRCNNNVFGKLSLIEDESYADDVRFGMLPWKVFNEEFNFDALYTSIKVTVPRTYEVYLNDIKLGPEYIVEDNIHYDVLEDYYDQFEGLPTKVTYEYDKIIGTLEPKILDENGNVFTVDASRDDSQFIKDCPAEELDKLSSFTVSFLDRYFRYICGVGDPMSSYQQLAAYLELGAELDQRMQVAMDGLGWSHTSSVKVDSSQLNGAVDLGDGFYLLDVSASTTVYYPGKSDTGEVNNDQNMKIIVKETAGDSRASSLELYGTIINEEEPAAFRLLFLCGRCLYDCRKTMPERACHCSTLP